MNKRIIFFLCLVMLLPSIHWITDSINNSSVPDNVAIHSQMKVQSLPLHAPIIVNGNANFTSYGVFTGYGNSTHPYVFKDYFIDAGAATGISISNTNAYFIIENVWINGSSSTGIYLNYVVNGIINNCTVTNNSQYGIYLQYSNNNILANNTILKSGYGITLWFKSSSNILINNTVSNTSLGFLIIGSSTLNSSFNNTFINNTAFDNDYGFDLSVETYNNSFIHNNAYRNNLAGFFSQTFSTPISNKYINNTANNNEVGFKLSGANISYIGNIASNNIEYGFYLTGTTLSLPLIVPAYSGQPVNIASNNGIADFNINGSLFWTSIPDIAIIETDINTSITWFATSSSASNYTIYLNDSDVQHGLWISGKNITYSLQYFLPNKYNITLSVSDLQGNVFSYSIIITIPDKPLPETTTITSILPASTITDTTTETTTSLGTFYTTIFSKTVDTISKTTQGFEIVIISIGILSFLIIRRKIK